MTAIAISGTGLYTPPHSISNDELVFSFNAYVDQYNKDHSAEITAGTMAPLQHSSSEFIVKASGILSRHVVDKEGILNPGRMMPNIPERASDQMSLMAEMGVSAARQAIEQAGKTAADIDGVIVACSNMQRPYPAIAIEIQNALGIDGFGFDMNVACSSATFGIQAAADMVRAGNARALLVVNPEICSGHLNFRDRDSHFIFGDVATAVLLERREATTAGNAFEIVGTRLKTSYSNNIRNNFGFLSRTVPETMMARDKLFLQEGRKVFKEVIPMVSDLILSHMESLALSPSDIRRVWLHQANIHMNEMIGANILGRTPANDEAPVILDEYANTSSAGSIIAFHKNKTGLRPGDHGIICSFGAGYSVGSVVVRRI